MHPERPIEITIKEREIILVNRNEPLSAEERTAYQQINITMK